MLLVGGERDHLEERGATRVRVAERLRGGARGREEGEADAPLGRLGQDAAVEGADVDPELVEVVAEHERIARACEDGGRQLLVGQRRLAVERVQDAEACGVGEARDLEQGAGLAGAARARQEHAAPLLHPVQDPRVEPRRVGVVAVRRRDERKHLREQVAAEAGGHVGEVIGMADERAEAEPEPAVGDAREAIEQPAEIVPVGDAHLAHHREPVLAQVVEERGDLVRELPAGALVREHRAREVDVALGVRPRVVGSGPALLGLIGELLRDLLPGREDVLAHAAERVVVVLALEDDRPGEEGEERGRGGALLEEDVDAPVAPGGGHDADAGADELAEGVACELLEGVLRRGELRGPRALPRGGGEVLGKRLGHDSAAGGARGVTMLPRAPSALARGPTAHPSRLARCRSSTELIPRRALLRAGSTTSPGSRNQSGAVKGRARARGPCSAPAPA